MPPCIISSRTRGLYENPPDGDFVLNEASDQARGLVAFWPLSAGKGRYLDYARKRLFPMTVTGTNGLGQSWDGGRGYANAATAGNYLTCATTPITGVGFTLNTWLYLRDATDYGRESSLVSVCRSTASFNSGDYASLLYDGANGEGNGSHLVTMDASGGGTRQAFATAAVAGGGRSVMATGTFTAAAANGCAVYYNAGSTATCSGTPTTPASWAGIQVGCLRSTTTTFSPLSGVQSWAAAWNIVLTAGQVVKLYDPKTRYELAYVLGRTAYSFQAAGGVVRRRSPMKTMLRM